MSGIHFSGESFVGGLSKYQMVPSSFGLTELLPIAIIETFKQNEPTLEDWAQMGTLKVALYATTYFAAMVLNITLIPLSIVVDIVAGIAESIFASFSGEKSAAFDILYEKVVMCPVQQAVYGSAALVGMCAMITYTCNQIAYRLASSITNEHLTYKEAVETKQIFIPHFLAHAAISFIFEKNVLSTSPTAEVENFASSEYFNVDDSFYSWDPNEKSFRASLEKDFEEFYKAFYGSKGNDFNFNEFNFDGFDFDQFNFNFEGTQGGGFNGVQEDTQLLDFQNSLKAAKEKKFATENDAAKLAKKLCALKSGNGGVPSPEIFMGLGDPTLSQEQIEKTINDGKVLVYTKEELLKAYRKRALVFHPDRNLDNKEAAAEMFKTITAANVYLQEKLERLG